MKFHDYIEQSIEWQRERGHAENLRRRGMTQRATVKFPTDGGRNDGLLVVEITEDYEGTKA